MLAPLGPPRYDLVIQLREQHAPVMAIPAPDGWSTRHKHTGERFYRWSVTYKGIDVASIDAATYPDHGKPDGIGEASLTQYEAIDYLPTFYRQQLVDFAEFLDSP